MFKIRLETELVLLAILFLLIGVIIGTIIAGPLLYYKRPQLISPDEIAESLRLASNYLLRAQKPGGDFNYEYKPRRASYSNENFIVRQIGTAYVLANYYRETGDSRAQKAVEKFFDYYLPLSKTYDSPFGKARYITDGPQNFTNSTALFLLAVGELMETNSELFQKYESLAQELANHLLSMQKPTGAFRYYFLEDGTYSDKEDHFTNGEAFFALAKLSRLTNEKRLRDAAEKSAALYQFTYENFNNSFYAWGMGGYYELYLADPKEKYAQFMFAQTDELLAGNYFRQIENYAKGIPLLPGGNPSVYIEGVGRAYQVAKLTADIQRQEIYRDAMLKA
ncbi:MAG: hypothetical protein ACK4NX_03370, partial [Candidatus Paceibacteria bacterium]